MRRRLSVRKTLFLFFVATFRITRERFCVPKTEWNRERVAAFVEQECGLPMYKKLFIQHHVTGKIVGLITKQDLIDMGITKIGHQIRLLQKFKPFQAAQSAHKRLEGVRSWTEFVWPWHCFRFCYPRKFKLTQSGLRIRQDFFCGTWCLCSSARISLLLTQRTHSLTQNMLHRYGIGAHD